MEGKCKSRVAELGVAGVGDAWGKGQKDSKALLVKVSDTSRFVFHKDDYRVDWKGKSGCGKFILY